MAKLKQIIIPVISLFIICVVISGALSATNHITKDAIEKANADALNAMLKSSVPEADEFIEKGGDAIYYEAKKENELLAYVYSTSAKGYGGDISVLTAISKDGEIIKVTVSDASSETTGIGTKVVNNNDFLSQFSGKKEELTDFDAITGATYSSTGVKNAVNNALKSFKEKEAGK